MAKKTNFDRLQQLYRIIVNNENIVEDYNSEKTAKAEYNKMTSLINLSFLGLTVDSLERGISNIVDEYVKEFGVSVDKIIDILKPISEIIRENGSINLRSDCLSVKDSNSNLNVDNDIPHYGFYTTNRNFRWKGGTYRANCVEITNTSKQLSIKEYIKLCDDCMKKAGTYSDDVLPREIQAYRKRDNQQTKRMYDSKADKMKQFLKSSLPAATPKQIAFIISKTNLTENEAHKLNKYQATELVGAIIDHNWDILDFYKCSLK